MSVKNTFTIGAALLIIYGCTHNPLFDDKPITVGKITGNVMLDTGDNPKSNVFVWLAGFDIGTVTDTNGDFRLNLPSESGQGAGEGYSGEYSLYFYTENCILDSLIIVFANGIFVGDQAIINNDGSLKSPIVLKQLFTLESTIVGPNTLRSVLTSNEDVRFLCLKNTVNHVVHYTGFFVYNSDSTLIKAYKSSGFVTQPELIVHDSSFIMDIYFNPLTLGLPQGTYSVVPYVCLLRTQHLPAGLIDHFSEEAWEFHSAFLRLPFLRTDAVLTVE
ncbi:MAG: hypothetical protein H8E64_09550 [Candidatus Marinimicrobia bacterium]|nr:hypothetical protein [Candidatus Neomarinimicrobiota bacterium]